MRRLNIPFRSGSKSDHSSISRETSNSTSQLPALPELPNPTPGSPEAKIIENINAFCEPRYRSDPNEPESSYLPGVIEPAEASPQAAAWAARKILEYFPEPDDPEDAAGKKDKKRKGKFNGAEPPILYNAINLLGLLSAHPGKPFTQNLNNEHAVGRVKAVLVHERDPSVQQILREELNKLDGSSRTDNNLQPLVAMWSEEKKKRNRQPHAYARPVPTMGYGAPMPPQPSRHGSHQVVLPPPDELAGRVHEATETAKLLIQITQASSPESLESDEMIQDVAERSRKASRSLQGYIDCTNPHPPDPETMQTLINTYQAVSVALIRYWTAVMNARKILQQTRQPINGQESTLVNLAAQRPSPPPPQDASIASAQINGRVAQDDPFSDSNQPQRKPYSLFGKSKSQQPQAPTDTRQQPGGEVQESRYNPGFRSTPSYVARQDSAIGNVTMHGASPPPDQSETATR